MSGHHHHHDHEHDHDHGEHHHHEHGDHEHHDHDEEVYLSPQEFVTMLRKTKDEWMAEDAVSPIPAERRQSFKGLSYYPFDESLFLELPLDRDVVDEPITMETSTGDEREFTRAGKVRFDIGDESAELTVFRAAEGDLFLPLRDATSGSETYGAGRYLEPQEVEDGTLLVDFNELYNPYCAYNEAYSCPLPPRENWLAVPIRAGEKTFESE